MNSLFWLYALNAIVFFTRGLEDITGLPIFFLFKEKFHYNESQIMYLSSLIGIPWLIKPIWGFLADFCGLTKKQIILGTVLFAFLICGFIGISPILPIPLLIGLMLFQSSNSAIANVTVDGAMICGGRDTNSCGKIQTLQWSSITIAGIITGALGGYLAQYYPYQISYLLLLPLYILIFCFTLQYKEPPKINVKKEAIWPILKSLFQDKSILLFSLFIFLYNFSPSFGVPLTFIQVDKWHWSKTFIGILGTIGAICSLGGAWLYWQYSKKIDLNKWLYYSVFIGAVTQLLYLYFTPISCILYSIVLSIIGMGIQLLMLDFMARKTKIGVEIVCFALLCSVNNITGTINNLSGAFLYPLIGLNALIIISSLTSFLCLPLLRRIRL